MKHTDFVHLHVQTQYSLLEGACQIKPLIKKAVELRFPALAITDHGNLFGAIPFYQTAMAEGIKPIIGMGAYVAPSSRFEKTSHGIKDASFQLNLLCRDDAGYHNLMKLSSIGYLEGFYYKPRVDKDVLKKYSDGLIAMSGCQKGEIPYYLRNNQKEEAIKAIQAYQEIFGPDNFYLEIYDHGIPDEKMVVDGLIELGRELGAPIVATNDVFYIDPDDAQAHDVLLCIGNGTTIDQENRVRLATNQYHLRSAAEMVKLFEHVPEAIKNTKVIAERCNLELDFSKTFLPKFEPPAGETEAQYVRKLCDDGLRSKLPAGSITQEYIDRLDYELGTIEQMGYYSYFLTVWDFIHYAKQQGIPVGPGRGSAAGSLVAYSLGITNLDPLKYGLIFERFLNPDRVSMPDIDIDFCYERRDEVIDYVKRKYGQDNVAQIITFGTMAAKGVVRDVGRAMNMSFQEVDAIAKLVPAELNMTLELAMKQEPRLKDLVKDDARVGRLMENCLALEGMTRHAGKHAAGVVISDFPLTDRVPLYKSKDLISTQYSMNILEKVGLLKVDFLGLKTLTMIDKTCKAVKARQGIEIDIDTIPLDDTKAYDLLCRAETFGVFQLESSGMRDILKKLQPRVFDDITALLALYRPGPLGSGMVDDFIKCKHDPTKIKYDHPALEPVLKETYGVILYQEQVMKIVSELAGFSLAKADLLRRAMGKKIVEVMEREKTAFIDGSVKNGLKVSVADKIWRLIEYFSGYGFNKSHSAAYAFVSYQTAYLKANYPVEFMTSLLTTEMGNTDKIVRHIDEAKRMGISVLAPSVNESVAAFKCLPTQNDDEVINGTIRFGLSAVKNVGSSAIETIVAEREKDGEYKSFFDLTERVDLRQCNRKVLESLIRAGAFDACGMVRARLMAMLDQAIDMGSKRQRDRQTGQTSFLDIFEASGDEFATTSMPDVEEWPESQLLAYEKEVLGFYLSAHPLSKYEKILQTYATATSENLADFSDGAEVTVGGIINSLKEITTKKGDRMAFASFEDLTGSCEVVIFPKMYKECVEMLTVDATLFVRGKINMRDDQPSLLAEELIPLSEVSRKLTRGVSVNLVTTGLSQDTLGRLKTILDAHKGQVPLYLTFKKANGTSMMISAGDTFRVDTNDELFQQIEDLLGENSIKIKT